MPMKIPPKFCPVIHPEYLTPAEIVDCQCVSYAGAKEGLLAQEGHSGFCMGKIKTHTFKLNDVRHDNNYVLCIFGPVSEAGREYTGENTRVVTNLINRNDMRLLHGMMHEAVGPDRPFRIEGRKQGFMEADPDSEEREEVITDDARERGA